MKKIKLISGIATVATLGATLGVPASCSCNQNLGGTIKLKLADGIVAKTKDFKIGDKVVITYTIKDENLAVTGDCITVKFDGQIVKPSKNTWSFNTNKKQITIFSAPTTDISIEIRTVGYTEPEQARTNFAVEGGSVTIADLNGTEIPYIDVPINYTYAQMLTLVRVTYDQSAYTLTWMKNGVELDQTETVVAGATITAHLDEIVVPSVSYKLNVWKEDGVALGTLNPESGIYTDEWTINSDDWSTDISFNTFKDTYGEVFVAYYGTKFEGFVDENGTDIGSQTISQYLSVEGNKAFAKFVYDEDGDAKAHYMTYNSEKQRFECPLWFNTSYDNITLIVDTNLIDEGFTVDGDIFMWNTEDDVMETSCFSDNTFSPKVYEYSSESSTKSLTLNRPDGSGESFKLVNKTSGDAILLNKGSGVLAFEIRVDGMYDEGYFTFYVGTVPSE